MRATEQAVSTQNCDRLCKRIALVKRVHDLLHRFPSPVQRCLNVRQIIYASQVMSRTMLAEKWVVMTKIALKSPMGASRKWKGMQTKL